MNAPFRQTSSSFKQYASLLTTYLTPLRGQVALLALLILAGTALQLLNPLIIRSFIDTAELGGALRDLLIAAVTFIGVALLYQAVSVLQTFLAEKTAWRATNALRTDLTRHCLRLDMSFHNARTPGELIERIDGDVGALARFFSQFALSIIANILLMLGILVILFGEDWRMGLPILLFVIGALLVTNYVRDLATPYWKAASESFAQLMGFLEERLVATEDIRANGVVDYMMVGLYRRLRDRLHTLFPARMMMIATFTTSLGLVSLSNVMALGVGAYLLQLNAITIGTVYLLFHYTKLLIQPLEILMDELNGLQRASASIARIQELFELPSEVAQTDSVTLPLGSLSVNFQNVSFRYTLQADTTNANDLTIQNISFQLKPGEVLGLAGRTGSGKTTLTRLIARLYDPTSGTIQLGGVAAHQVDPTMVRQQIGLVTQDVQLFQASVRNNLTFFDESVADQQILEALHILGLEEWYNALPHGLDTVLSPGGQGLSAGEAQLLAFTRVLLKDPGLVILDEASSRLDPQTERLVNQAVRNLLGHGQRTGIIIAHRLATLQRVDSILILENGRIAEYGNRKELAKNSQTRFYQLLQANARQAGSGQIDSSKLQTIDEVLI